MELFPFWGLTLVIANVKVEKQRINVQSGLGLSRLDRVMKKSEEERRK